MAGNDSDSGFFQKILNECSKIQQKPRRMSKKLNSSSKLEVKSSVNFSKMSKKFEIGQDIINILAQSTIPIVNLESDESTTNWPEPDPNDVITIDSTEDEQGDEATEAEAETAADYRPRFVIRHHGLRTEEQARRVEQARMARELESNKILAEEMTAMLDKQESDKNNNTTDGVESESSPSPTEYHSYESGSGKRSNEPEKSNISSVLNPAPKKYGRIKKSIFDKQLFKQNTKVYIKKLFFTNSELEDILVNGLNVKDWRPTFSKFSFAKINGLSSSGHRILMMSTDSESESNTGSDNENHSLGKISNSSEASEECNNPACTEHGRGDDESESETDSVESDLHLENNLVQDGEGNMYIAVTETQEESTISKLERMYHMKLKMLQASVRAALAEVDEVDENGEGTEGKTPASRIGQHPESKFPVIIRWHHGGFLNQNAPVDIPHLDDRSLNGNDTAGMTKKQIKNWLAYRTSVENEISETNRKELKQVATDLRDTFFKIVLRVLPDEAKEKKLRMILKKAIWDNLNHIARLPGMGEEIDKILRVRPWPEALTNKAMRRVYLIIAGYVQDIPEKWVYIRRDYKLEDEPHVDPNAGERVVKNSDVKVVSRSCIHTQNTENKCTHGAGADVRFKSLDESEEGGAPLHTSTPKQPEPEPDRYEYIIKSDGSVIKHDQILSRNRVAACNERIARIKAEIESRSKDVIESRKADLIRKIVAAQAASKKRKKRRQINAWAKVHITRQREASRKASRAKDKEENRADPKGKRYMPGLGDQTGSSETYESTSSDDSIPEANWERWPLGSTGKSTNRETTGNPVTVGNVDGTIGLRRSIRSAKWVDRSGNNRQPINPVAAGNLDGVTGPAWFQRSIVSIKDRLKSSERKEGCTCPGGECKWEGECFSPKE